MWEAGWVRSLLTAEDRCTRPLVKAPPASRLPPAASRLPPPASPQPPSPTRHPPPRPSPAPAPEAGDLHDRRPVAGPPFRRPGPRYLTALRRVAAKHGSPPVAADRVRGPCRDRGRVRAGDHGGRVRRQTVQALPVQQPGGERVGWSGGQVATEGEASVVRRGADRRTHLHPSHAPSQPALQTLWGNCSKPEWAGYCDATCGRCTASFRVDAATVARTGAWAGWEGVEGRGVSGGVVGKGGMGTLRECAAPRRPARHHRPPPPSPPPFQTSTSDGHGLDRQAVPRCHHPARLGPRPGGAGLEGGAGVAVDPAGQGRGARTVGGAQKHLPQHRLPTRWGRLRRRRLHRGGKMEGGGGGRRGGRAWPAGWGRHACLCVNPATPPPPRLCR